MILARIYVVVGFFLMMWVLYVKFLSVDYSKIPLLDGYQLVRQHSNVHFLVFLKEKTKPLSRSKVIIGSDIDMIGENGNYIVGAISNSNDLSHQEKHFFIVDKQGEGIFINLEKIECEKYLDDRGVKLTLYTKYEFQRQKHIRDRVKKLNAKKSNR